MKQKVYKVVILLLIALVCRLCKFMFDITREPNTRKWSEAININAPPTNEGDKKKIPCHWTILAGDSNTRELHAHWLSAEKFAKRKVIPLGRTGSLLPQSRLPNGHTDHEEPYVNVPLEIVDCFYIKERKQDMIKQYADKEYLILQQQDPQSNPFPFDKECHIFTTKFMQHQEGVKRYARNFTNSDFCGTVLEPLPDGYERPAKPDFIWFSHGLWNLPNSWGRGKNHSNLNCSNRFTAVLDAFNDWKELSIPFIWQTLSPINKHPAITNAYIKWDYKCQKLTSKRHQIPVFDIYSKIERRFDIRQNDYHYTQGGIYKLLNVLWTEMFGGQKQYLGTKMFRGKNSWHKKGFLNKDLSTR